MSQTFRPQPLLSEVLSGALTLALALVLIFDQHREVFLSLRDRPTAGLLSLGAFLFASWIAGTILDSMRNLLEDAWDKSAPINWDFFFAAEREKVFQLDENYFIYYCAKANYSIGMVVLISVFLFCNYFGFLPFDGVASVVLALSFVILVICFFDARSLRKEIRKLIGHRDAAHSGVYTRLKPSANGVGVFAIRDIPKGTNVFATDENGIREIDPRDFSMIAPELKKLYKDFCVYKDGKWVGPTNFNNLTPGWYLNHSEKPSVGIDADYNFLALRNIAKGEELTADYRTYDDRPINFSERDCS